MDDQGRPVTPKVEGLGKLREGPVTNTSLRLKSYGRYKHVATPTCEQKQMQGVPAVWTSTDMQLQSKTTTRKASDHAKTTQQRGAPGTWRRVWPRPHVLHSADIVVILVDMISHAYITDEAFHAH